ncbi:MAG: hypothetical protein FWF96_06305, partial [Kiritimatiellaeota bacterium]|nr:hypothetical protein [Kiritimatiellota bacterium]
MNKLTVLAVAGAAALTTTTAKAGTIEWSVSGVDGTYIAVLMQREAYDFTWIGEYDATACYGNSISGDIWGAVDVLRLNAGNFGTLVDEYNYYTADLVSEGPIMTALHTFLG